MLVRNLLISVLTAFLLYKFLNLNPPSLFVVKYANTAAYVGIIFCFSFSALGTLKGMRSIANSVSGGSILIPRIGSKSTIGTVFCEANFLCGMVMCFFLRNGVALGPAFEERAWLTFSVGTIVGVCSYFSSVSTGIICNAITMMDAKDPTLFISIFVIAVISSSTAILGLVLGFVLQSKIDKIK